MSDNRGIFRLSNVVDDQIAGNWVNLDDVWITNPGTSSYRYKDNTAESIQTGYFGSGEDSNASFSTSIDKLNFSTDTVTLIPGNVSVARFQIAATSSTTAGYFAGGRNPVLSTMDKLTYSSDTAAAVPGAFLVSARYDLTATGNATAGYFGGGTNASYAEASSMDKITYSSDTTAAVPGAVLSAARSRLSAVGNQSFGYFSGGSPNGSLIDKVTYSSDTTAVVPGLAIAGGRYNDSTSGNSTHGYFLGGQPSAAGGVTSSTNKLTYSTQTIGLVPSATIPILPNESDPPYSAAATGGPSAGYLGGGLPGSWSAVFKISYATDTFSPSPSSNLTIGRNNHAASSAVAHANPYTSPPASTPTPQTAPITIPGSPTTNFGYFSGGNQGNAGPTALTLTEKLTFSSDTIAASPSASLTLGRNSSTGVGNQNSGYIIAGADNNNPTPSISTTDKLTYSSDTTAAVPALNVSPSIIVAGGAGNQTNGYMAGGYDMIPANPVSQILKITYSTETSSLTSNLSEARSALGSVSSSTAGYFGGGSAPAYSYVLDKITYSTDTVASTPTFFVPQRSFLRGSSSSTAGYFAGSLRSPGANSQTTKLTFSTDTIATLPATGSLKSARYDIAATGNTTNGYFGGGTLARSTPDSRMDKLTYSNDTMAAAPSGNLTASRYAFIGISPKHNNLPATTVPTTSQAPVIL
jgi:hypothetical protein